MAERKRLETGPVLDSVEPDCKSPDRRLPAHAFKSVIRAIKKSASDSIDVLLKVMTKRLEELGVKPDLDATVSGIPEGSDHLDIGTLRDWAAQVKKTDKRAVFQIQQIQATAHARVNG